MEAQIRHGLGHTLMEAFPATLPDYALRPTYIRNLGELAQLLQQGAKSNQTPTAADQPTQELLQTLFRFIQASTWAESQQVLVAHPELLTDETETLLDRLIETARQQGDNDAHRIFTKHRTLLRHCRELGMAAAFAEKMGQPAGISKPPRDSDNLPPELAHLLNNLTPDQRKTLLAILARATDAESFNRELANHPDLLAALQQFAPPSGGNIPTDLQPILQELSQPAQLSDMPRRVQLCRQALTMVSRTENVPLWGALQGELGNSLQQNPQGSRAANIEQAIAAYQQSLEVKTRQTMPVEWPTTMMNLANAYRDRIRGERAANIEQAISAYQQVLEVMTRQAMPVEWATTMNNLANAYYFRIRGERAANIEQAIAAFQQALEVRTRQAMPVEWAEAMNNLAIAYYSRIRGERADNIEQAIAALQQALEVRTRQAMPVEWAEVMMNLANAYSDRIRGERADNIEQAIAAYQQVLEVMTRQAMPVTWATTMTNLATAYRDRIRGERADNIEQAIVAYQQALEVRTRQAMPVEWATTMNNLATAYSDRIRGERADNIEQAIAALQQVLEVRTRQAMPVEWAEAMNNLAIAYYSRIRGERAANLEQAIAAFQQALEVRTRQAMPVDWAATMNNLANAYSDRIRGERADNIEQAIAAFQQALEVTTLDLFPSDHRQTQRNLGNLHFTETRWQESVTAYQAALEAGQVLLDTAYTETGRQAEVRETAQLFARSAYCQLKLGQYGTALVTLDSGKTRLLSQALALDESYLAQLPLAQQDTIRQHRQTIRELEAEMRLPPNTPGRRNDRTVAEALQEVRQTLRESIEAIQQDYPDFMPTGLDLPELLALIPAGGALVAPVVTSQGSAVFVIPAAQTSEVSKTSEVWADYVVWLDEFTDDSLQNILLGQNREALAAARRQEDIAAFETLLVESADIGWLLSYAQFLQNSETNRERWFDTVERILAQTRNNLITPIVEKLTQLGIPPGSPLLLLPQGGLGLLPLHALLLDGYAVTVAPGGYALHTGWRRLADLPPAGHLTAVINPTADLPFTPAEGEVISAHFEADCVTAFWEKEANKAALQAALQTERETATIFHFSGHGFYNWRDPLQSGLVLASSERLTLSVLLSSSALQNTRLVVLSACETGLTDIRQSPDEFLGLPAGFLQAGAPAIISTL